MFITLFLSILLTPTLGLERCDVESIPTEVHRIVASTDSECTPDCCKLGPTSIVLPQTGAKGTQAPRKTCRPEGWPITDCVLSSRDTCYKNFFKNDAGCPGETMIPVTFKGIINEYWTQNYFFRNGSIILEGDVNNKCIKSMGFCLTNYTTIYWDI